MLRAHRQAWAWQDEWVGMKMEDIRKYEEDTARYLSEVMASTSPHHSPTAKIKMSGFNQSIDSEDSINLPNNSTKSGTWAYPCRDEQIPPIDEECSSLVSSDIFFDCCDDFPEEATEHDANTTQYQKQRPQQIVQWNSELLQNCESESNSPVTPKWQNHDSSLLILVFHADFYPSVSFFLQFFLF